MLPHPLIIYSQDPCAFAFFLKDAFKEEEENMDRNLFTLIAFSCELPNTTETCV